MGLLDSKEKQEVLLFRSNMTIKPCSLVVKGATVRDEKGLAAFFRFREYLTKHREFGKGNSYVLPIDDRSAIPISPYKLMTDDEIIDLVDGDSVSIEAEKVMSSEQESQQNKSHFNDMMGIAVMGMVFFLMVVVILFLSGRIKLGGA